MSIQYPKQLVEKKVLSVLTKYIEEVCKIKISVTDLRKKNLKFDLDFDSLDLVEIIMDIETELDCSIESDNDNKIMDKTVDEFIDYLYKYLNEGVNDEY